MTFENSTPIHLKYELDAAPAKVWRALTIPEYVSQWLGRPKEEDAIPDEEAAPFELRLISAEPDVLVRYSIRENDAVSVVTFQIDANSSGGTTFHIVHELAAMAQGNMSMLAANSNWPRKLQRTA